MTQPIYPTSQTTFAGAPAPAEFESIEPIELSAPKYSPHKALVPVIMGVSAVLVQWVETGALNAAEVQTAIGSIVTAVMVFLVPNEVHR